MSIKKHCERCDCPETWECYDRCHIGCSCCLHDNRQRDFKTWLLLWGFLGFFMLYGMWHFSINVLVPIFNGEWPHF